jgi:flavin reductase (DIM6/NTAB) family NADH-FMN oxidoreductase RutF
MEAVINDLAAHNIQNRTVAIIENGSWAAASGGLIREKLEKCKDVNILENIVSIKSALKSTQLSELEAMADAILETMPNISIRGGMAQSAGAVQAPVDPAAMFKLSYGLFVLTAKDGEKDNGCIINAVSQLTDTPLRIAAAVNKANYTHGMIAKTGVFNLSVLAEGVPFRVFERFGFGSGKEKDKFEGCGYDTRTENGIRYVPEHTNGVISAKVMEPVDCGTHTLFIAEVTRAFVASGEPSVTYQYYFDHIKPRPQAPKAQSGGFACKICGFVYEGDAVPGDYICPLCKHGADAFEPV